jgi:hypothetical protein
LPFSALFTADSLPFQQKSFVAFPDKFFCNHGVVKTIITQPGANVIKRFCP